MKLCVHCGGENDEGAVFCVYCGKELAETQVVDASEAVRESHPLPEAPIKPELTLMVVTPQGMKPITLPYGKWITLGRSDRQSQLTPHIDLATFDALELGVSRLHAVIDHTLDGATITDLGSTNGTYLNGKKLEPQEPYIMQYSDELRLGRLIVYIYTQ